MDLDSLFGIDLDQPHFHIDRILDIAGLSRDINGLSALRELIAENGRDHPIVSIAKRQYALKALKPLLDRGLLPYDAHFQAKEIKTATDNDRRYAAEDKLLQLCLVIATGRTPRQLQSQNFKPSIDILRELPRRSHFERFWEILADHTRDLVMGYQQARAANAPAAKQSFWRRLFS
ncbi:MAG: hypothetical protein HYV16_04540 [Gammaproteobacteria bacterium]|nr:hypothetical protein [Gammaproteobacteria bacterium]